MIDVEATCCWSLQHPFPTSSSNRPSFHLGICLLFLSEPAHGWVHPHLAQRPARWLTPSPGIHSYWLRGRHVTQIWPPRAPWLNLPAQRRCWNHGVHCVEPEDEALKARSRVKEIQRSGVIRTLGHCWKQAIPEISHADTPSVMWLSEETKLCYLQ